MALVTKITINYTFAFVIFALFSSTEVTEIIFSDIVSFFDFAALFFLKPEINMTIG